MKKITNFLNNTCKKFLKWSTAPERNTIVTVYCCIFIALFLFSSILASIAPMIVLWVFPLYLVGKCDASYLWLLFYLIAPLLSIPCYKLSHWWGNEVLELDGF